MRLLPFALAAAALMAGCGYVGNPLPPLANVPAAVQGLTAVERGARILIQFPVAQRTTEGMLIKPPIAEDVRIGVFSGADFNADAWAAQAQRVTGGAVTNGVALYQTSIAPWVGKEAIVAVRVTGGNRKQSAWSNFAIVEVVPEPEQPRNLSAMATPRGVSLTWSARGDRFRVFRRGPGETGFTAQAVVEKAEWTDPNTDFGKRYAYMAQTLVKLANDKEALSDPSEETGITPEETFPPAVPTGLQAAVAPSSIELAWSANAESFLGGYRVYRATAGGAFEKLAEVGVIPSYSDHAVEAGKTYRYEVSAVSKTGHESPRSEPAEAALP
jgi:fibronectin type 3 domain-containing protein